MLLMMIHFFYIFLFSCLSFSASFWYNFFAHIHFHPTPDNNQFYWESRREIFHWLKTRWQHKKWILIYRRDIFSWLNVRKERGIWVQKLREKRGERWWWGMRRWWEAGINEGFFPRHDASSSSWGPAANTLSIFDCFVTSCCTGSQRDNSWSFWTKRPLRVVTLPLDHNTYPGIHQITQ